MNKAAYMATDVQTDVQTRAISKRGNGEWGNGGMGNGERGTGNGESLK